MSNIFQSDPQELQARIVDVKDTEYNRLRTSEEEDEVFAYEDRQRAFRKALRALRKKQEVTEAPKSKFDWQAAVRTAQSSEAR
jgi:hypothetical protein